MQMFRPSNERYEQQSYNHQSSIKPFFGAMPIGYGGSNNLTQCQTQTQCFDAQLLGADSGYGMQHAAGAHGCGTTTFPQKPFDQYAQHGSYGSMQHGGNGAPAHQGSYASMMQGGCGSTQHSSHANMAHHGSYAAGYGHGSAHHGSSAFGSGPCEAQSGGYCYSVKKRERRTWSRKRSGSDGDSSGSDESDNDH